MRQRLGIAASLLRSPRLLILDEPATGLDPAGMRDMRDLIRRLADDGITVLLSSHQLPEVRNSATASRSSARRRSCTRARSTSCVAAAAPATACEPTTTRRRSRSRVHRSGVAPRADHRARYRAPGREQHVGELSLALGRGRDRDPRADARARDARGAVLPVDRRDRPTARRRTQLAPRWCAHERLQRPPPRGAAAASRTRDPRHSPSTAGSCASCACRSAPTSASALGARCR